MIGILVNETKMTPERVKAGTLGSYYETIRFSFTGEWVRLNKKAVFYPARGKPVEVPLGRSNYGSAKIPLEVMSYSGFAKFVVSGYVIEDGKIEEKIITLPGFIEVDATLKDEGANSFPPTPNTYEILENKLGALEDSFEKTEESFEDFRNKFEQHLEELDNHIGDYDKLSNRVDNAVKELDNHIDDYGLFFDQTNDQFDQIYKRENNMVDEINNINAEVSKTNQVLLDTLDKTLDNEKQISENKNEIENLKNSFGDGSADSTGIHIGEDEPTDGSEVWIDTDEEAASGGASIDVTAEVGQTIVVKAVDGNGKPTKWESADYQQRTHYENGTKANTLLNCNVPITNNQYAELGVLGFEDGQTYKVSWNGTEYVCISVTVPYDQTTTAITIGNLGLMGGTNTGEPFLIAQLDNGFIAFASAANGTFSVKITEEVPSYKTIDEYYLPNRAKTYVLTANDYELNQAFIQDVEIESAHLANKLLDLLWNGYDILIDFSDISLSPPVVCQAKVLGWFYFENSLQLMFAVNSGTRHITIKGGTWTPPTT